MSNSSFAPNKKQPKVVRLVGSLSVNINGQIIKLSENFKVQTDLSYSGMTLAEQDTALHAVAVALAKDADISFAAEFVAEEVKTSATKGPQAPSPIDLMLAELTKPKPADLVEAVVRDDTAKLESKSAALDILGATDLPESFGAK